MSSVWIWFLLVFGCLYLGFGQSASDSFLIDCGSSGNATDPDGREFTGEDVTSYTTSGILGSTISDSQVSNSLLLSARFFTSKSSYKFPVSTGRHWVRLYFYPFKYSYFDPNSSVFSVAANGYTLLSNLSVGSELKRLSTAYLFKEYNFNVASSPLYITFLPSSSSFAFINAIEVISVPDNYADDAVLVNAGKKTSFGMSYIALETMYRLNVGGAYVGPSNDSSLSRTWDTDDSSLYAAIKGQVYSVDATIKYPATLPSYTAPPSVFKTARTATDANLTWTFDVDTNYTYYLRLLFCELQYNVAYARIFDVYINDMMAYPNLDIVALKSAAYIPLYIDFALQIQAGSTIKLTLSPSPNSGSQFNSSILNGLEILKMNNSVGSLAGTSVPAGTVETSDQNSSSSSKGSVGVIAGSVAGGIAAIGIAIAVFIYMRKPKGKPAKGKSASWLPLPMHGGNSTSIGSKFSVTSHKSGTGSVISTAASSLGGRFFTFAEILDATNNFDETLLLGVGGFGKVYKGELFDGTKIAVKRGNPRSEQGMTEFQTEIEMLSKLRHRHLVSLIGYCEEQGEMILVYECMENGTLRAHLYGSDLPPLSWKQRLDICIGAARGLHYLHTGAAQGIIHRDVKTTNILLDENFVAKVSDFGLSKTGPSLDRTHVSTAVKGSFGYLDPEYFRRQQLTEKSDVYSFGVVLFEVMCARPAINPALPRDQVNIAEWAMQYQKMGLLEQIIDPHLKGQYNPESLRKFGETAEKCLAEQGIDRPPMGDVLWNLEYALQLQETSIANGTVPADNKINEARLQEIPLRAPKAQDYSANFGSEDDFEDASASAVFSQLVNPQGR